MAHMAALLGAGKGEGDSAEIVGCGHLESIARSVIAGVVLGSVAARPPLRHGRAMIFTHAPRLRPSAWCLIAFGLVAAGAATPAPGQQGKVLQPVAEAVQVRGYPVGEGPSETFTRRHEATTRRIVDEVVAARGVPLLREDDGSHLRLVYRDALVVVTGYYSGAVVCRVDIDPARLRETLNADQVIGLAAQSCRVAEEQGWGAAGLIPVGPIGAEALPGVPGATVEMHATDASSTLFPLLVRDVEVRGKTVSLLVRRDGRDEPSMRHGVARWRYAWFADGSFLALRFQAGTPGRDSREAIGLACVVRGPARLIPRLDSGPFVSWCDRHDERLRPGLPAFVEAVRAYRREEERSAPGDRLPAMPGGLHSGGLPAELVGTFWKTGTVATPR